MSNDDKFIGWLARAVLFAIFAAAAVGVICSACRPRHRQEIRVVDVSDVTVFAANGEQVASWTNVIFVEEHDGPPPWLEFRTLDGRPVTVRSGSYIIEASGKAALTNK